MTIQTIDPQYFKQKTQRIKSQVSAVLTKWGLLPRFTRWRLTQDPSSGMIVLFGILNHRYIACHTTTPLSDYFDPRLLHDLANQLQVQIMSGNSDGMRYAFILDRGHIDKFRSHMDFPLIDRSRLMSNTFQEEITKSTPVSINEISMLDDRSFVRQVVGAVAKVFDDIKLKDDAIKDFAAQNHPDILIRDIDEFNERAAKHEANRQRIKRIGELLDKAECKKFQ